MTERSRIVELLRSDLYERVPDAEPETGMTLASPLGWRVRISGPREDPVVAITRPDGSHYFGPQPCSMERLDEVLP